MARLVGAFLHLVDNLLNVFLGDRCRAVFGTSHETGHLVGVLDQVPGVVVHHHFHQHIAGEELALGGAALAVLHLDHLLGRHEDAAELVLHAGAVDPLDDVSLSGFFHARVGMDHIPAHALCGHTVGHGTVLLGHYFLQPRIRS
ncbi:hypothetical protein D9M68_658790 [compost metagenome]